MSLTVFFNCLHILHDSILPSSPAIVLLRNTYVAGIFKKNRHLPLTRKELKEIWCPGNVVLKFQGFLGFFTGVQTMQKSLTLQFFNPTYVPLLAHFTQG